jgi:hypothetical protein
MNDRRESQNTNRPDPAAQVPEAQSRALHRRRSLDEQQRAFQGTYPPPHLFRRRPPG